MNEWLDEELAELEKAKQEQRAEKRRLKLLQEQTQVFWKNLKPVLQDAVEKINTTPRFRKLTGGLSYTGGPTDKIEIRKVKSPAIVLNLSCDGVSVSLHYVLLANIKAKSGRPQFHTLYVVLDEAGRPTLKDYREDTTLSVDQAAHHILRPFLRPELLE